MLSNIFYLENGVLKLNKYKVVVRRYAFVNSDEYSDSEHYVNDEGLNEIEVNFVPKHRLYEIVKKEMLDTSAYAWMEGIVLRTDNHAKEIEEIASYGSLEAYKASLPESTDEFKLDTDFRLSKLELGL